MNVTPVNDAPEVASGKDQITLPDIDEDSTPAGASVGSIFGPSFQDTRDTVSGGSTANGLAGIVVVGNTADSASEGSWQYHNGSTWVNIGTGRSDANALYLSAGTNIRFLPVADYNGDPPKLTVRLVDDAATDVANNPNLAARPADYATLNISGKVGGTTRYSAGTVDLFQPVEKVNDSPLVNGSGGGEAVVDTGKLYSDSDMVTTGKTVQDLFGGSYNDDKDQQKTTANPNGSLKNDFAGVLIGKTTPSTHGDWWYSADSGATWTKVVINGDNGLLLAPDATLKFVPNAGTKGEGDTQLTVRLVDSSAGAITSGNTASISGAAGGDLTDQYSEDVIRVTSYVYGLNEAPTISLPGPLTATERDQNPLQLAPGGVIADNELDQLTSWRGVTLSVSRQDGASADDRFVSCNTAQLGQLMEGGQLIINGVNVGKVTKNSGGELLLAFSENATKALVNDVLRNLGYHNDSHAPENSVTLKYVVNDGNEPGNGRQGEGGAKEGGTTQVINITQVPEDPVAVDDANYIGLKPGNPTSVSGNVLDNDSDPDETALRVVNDGVITGRYGTLTLNADGSYTYNVDSNNPAVRNLITNGRLVEIFNYEMADSNGGAHQFANLEIEIVNLHSETHIPPENPKPPAPPAPPPPLPQPPLPTPIQDEVGMIRENITQNINKVIDELNLIANRPDAHPAREDDIRLASAPDDRNLYIDYYQEFALPFNMFVHRDPNAELFIEATLEDGRPLPPWISFDGNSMSFKCTPPSEVKGSVNVLLLARDSKNNSAKAVLVLNIRTEADLDTQNGCKDPDLMRRLAGGADAPLEEIEGIEEMDAEAARLEDELAELLTALRAESGPEAEPQSDAREGLSAQVRQTGSFGLQLRSLELALAAGAG